MGVVWYNAFIGVCYHLVGEVAYEREIGMADLLDSMMPNANRLEPVVARVIGHWTAFSLVSKQSPHQALIC